MNTGLKIRYLAVICAMLSSSAFGQFQKIVEKLSEKNLSLVEAAIDKEQSENTSEVVDAQTDFYLSSTLEWERGRGASLFPQFSQESAYERAALTLGKQASWGGTFSFTHSYEDLDLSRWSSSVINDFGGTDAYTVTNALTYSQDLGKNLFGMTFRSQLRQAEIGVEVAKANYELVEENTLFQVFQTYLNTKLDKKLLRIQKDFLDRAQKRKNLISKRYKDGVAIRADYYKSENAFSRAKELLRDSQVRYEVSIQNLRELASYEVDEKTIKDFKSSKYFEVIKPSNNYNYLGNKELAVLDQRLMLAKEALKEYEVQDNYDITLDLAFSRTGLKNNFDDSLSASFDEDDFENRSVSLNVTVPLGTTADTYQRVNKSLDLKRSEFKRENSLKNIIRNDEVLRSELEKVKLNLESSQKRLNLDRKILKEQNRRYNRGQIDFDQVLSAEESLLETERSYYQYFSRVLVLKLGINHLYGELKNSLAKYSE